MIIYYMTKFLEGRAWLFIIAFSIIALILIWIFSSGRGSTDIDKYDFYDRFLSPNYDPVDATAIEKEKQEEYYKSILAQNQNSSNRSLPEENQKGLKNKSEEEEFIYETGASKGENESRRVIQKLTGKSFHKIRPSWLKNPVTGNFLELDCYNEELQLAIEYNGKQHDTYIKHFHGNRETFYNQKYRDLIKNRMAEEKGVYLINVSSNLKFKEIEPYIEKEYRKYLRDRGYLAK